MSVTFETANKIVQDAAYQLGLIESDIADVYAETNQNVILLRNLLNAAGRELVKAHGWQQLRGTYTFPTVASTQTYDLPTGFDRLVPDSVWDRTLDLKGHPISEQRYQELSALATTGDRPFTFFLKQGLFQIYPIPDSVRTIAYGYWTSLWAGGTTSPDDDRADTSTDKIWFDPELVVRLLKVKFKEAKNMDTTSARIDYEAHLSLTKSQDGAPPILNLTPRKVCLPDGTVPDGSWNL